MKIKEGVIITGLKIEMRPVLIAAETLWKTNGIAEGVTVTAGLEGLHSAGSLHYYGYALDFRTRYWDRERILAVARDLRHMLGDDYDVVIESTHMHVEYKTAGG